VDVRGIIDIHAIRSPAASHLPARPIISPIDVCSCHYFFRPLSILFEAFFNHAAHAFIIYAVVRCLASSLVPAPDATVLLCRYALKVVEASHLSDYAHAAARRHAERRDEVPRYAQRRATTPNESDALTRRI